MYKARTVRLGKEASPIAMILSQMVLAAPRPQSLITAVLRNRATGRGTAFSYTGPKTMPPMVPDGGPDKHADVQFEALVVVRCCLAPPISSLSSSPSPPFPASP